MPDALRVVVLAFGSAGDALPQIALAAELSNRGHRVQIAGNAEYRHWAESLNLPFAPFRNPPDGGDTAVLPKWMRRAQELVTHSSIYQSLERQRMVRLKVAARMRWTYDFLAGQPGDTVAVVRAYDLGARTVQERLGMLTVSVVVQPAAFRSVFDWPGLPLPGFAGPLLREGLWSAGDLYHSVGIGRDLNRFRREKGLPPVRSPLRRWIFSPDLVIGLFPEWFANPQPDWPPNTKLTGFALSDGGGIYPVPAELEAYLDSGDPPIVFTRGSQSRGGYTFFETSVEICRRLKRRGILLAPRRASIPQPLPDFVRHFEFVPLSALLPRAAALVHHGGVGTTALAFAAGVPQMAIPLFDDQPDNAARMERLGVGVRLSARAYRASNAAAALQSLMQSGEIAGDCRRVAALMAGQRPLEQAAQFIEEIALRRANRRSDASRD